MNILLFTTLCAALLVSGDTQTALPRNVIPVPPTRSLCPSDCVKDYYAQPEVDMVPGPIQSTGPLQRIANDCGTCNVNRATQTLAVAHAV